MLRLALVLLVAANAFAEMTPYTVAKLVHQMDAPLTEPLGAALNSPTPLVRATAARVAAVRGEAALLPALRELVANESDATAAREYIRALVLAGNDSDLTLAVQAASRFPEGMDNALALAVARRGGAKAIEAYLSKLRGTRMTNTTEFFRVALWGHGEALPFAGSRILGARDERGWLGLLGAVEESGIAMNGGVIAASLGSQSEDIRVASIWYLVRSYAIEPEAMHEHVKGKIAVARGEQSSNREDFGFELLRRMLGSEKKDDPRWLEFLAGSEADTLFARQTDAVLQYLTEEEYRVRYSRCEIQVRECVMPAKRSSRSIPSQPVAPPAFHLPDVLPAGLADAILSGTKCRDSWLGVATASVDSAGRVMKVDLKDVDTTRACKDAIDTLLRLSFATNTSLLSPLTGPVLLVRPARAALCLDEAVPEPGVFPMLLRAGKTADAPKVKKRVEPNFPDTARRNMGEGRNVLVILECVISREGCVRSIRFLTQSPYPELNGAAIMAISQWEFLPGRENGKPVDVIFNLTINFKVK